VRVCVCVYVQTYIENSSGTSHTHTHTHTHGCLFAVGATTGEIGFDTVIKYEAVDRELAARGKLRLPSGTGL
jgi:hypothetical protein